MSVLINRDEVLNNLVNGREKEVTLPAGRHIIQLRCYGSKSKPFVVEMPAGADKVLQVGMRRQSKLQWWVTVVSGAFWVPLFLFSKWWLLSLWALVIISLNVWIMRRRHESFELTELPA